MTALPRIARPRAAELGQLVSLKDAAAHLGVSLEMLRAMIDRRQIRAVRLGYGRGILRVSVAELQRVIDEGTTPG